MKLKALLEARHAYNKYYKPKPEHLKKKNMQKTKKETLWFVEPRLWEENIKDKFGDEFVVDKEDSAIYVLSSDRKYVYGIWFNNKKGKLKGVSFDTPRPYYLIK